MTGTRRRRLRLRSGAALVVIAGLALVVVAAPSAHAQGTSLLGWTAQADANTVDIVVDNTPGLSGAHPLTEADIPEDTSDYETGPYGHALASVIWPGATAGNLGSLSGELGLPAALAKLAAHGNDTIKAEAFYPAGPQQSTYPNGAKTGQVAQMQAAATANGVTASSGLSDLDLSGVIALQGLQGSSRAAAASTATASASGSFTGLSLLGGLITIGATTSSASATSNGTSPSGTSTTHIGALEVAGHTVSYGRDGLVVAPLTSNLLGTALNPVGTLVNTIVSLLNLKVTPLPEAVTSQGTAESITAGGLQISFALPSTESTSLDCSSLPSSLSQLSVLCTLPGQLQGLNVTVTLGRATVEAIATPPFTNVGGSPPTGAAPSPGSGIGTSPGAATPTGASGSTPVAGQSPTLAGASPSGSSSPPTSPAAIPISLSSPVKTSLLVLLMILAVAVGAGAIRVARHLEDPVAAGACPLDGNVA